MFIFECHHERCVITPAYGFSVHLIKHYRIGYVVGKACVKVWATKIHTQFQNYLHNTIEAIMENGARKERENKREC